MGGFLGDSGGFILLFMFFVFLGWVFIFYFFVVGDLIVSIL